MKKSVVIIRFNQKIENSVANIHIYIYIYIYDPDAGGPVPYFFNIGSYFSNMGSCFFNIEKI